MPGASLGWEAIHIVHEGKTYNFSIIHGWIPRSRFRCEVGVDLGMTEIRLEDVPDPVIASLFQERHRTREDLDQSEIDDILKRAEEAFGSRFIF